MAFMNFVKRHRTAVILLLAPILFCIVCSMLVSCIDNDIKYDKAISIAKKDFGCEKILWIDTGAEILCTGVPTVSKWRSHYVYYVVGEKDGEEIYILIPSDPELEKPIVTSWSLDYSFAQVVEKINECGAQYVAEVPDDYYNVKKDYIRLCKGDEINRLAKYYDVGDSEDSFYERLDVKAVFYYQWEDGEYIRNCIVTQESGELKAYIGRPIVS